MYTNAKSPPPKSALHMSGLSMLTLDRHRRNGYSIESFVVNQRGSPVGIKKKIKKELIGTSDYPSNKIFTISNFITFTRLILTLVFLYLFVTDNNRVIAIVIYAVAASTDWMDGQIARMTKTVSWLGKVMDPIYWPRHLSGHRHAYRAPLSPSPHRCCLPRKDCHSAAHDRLLAHAARVPRY